MFAWLGGGVVAIACLVGVVRCAGDEQKGAAAPGAEGSPPSEGERQASEARNENGPAAALAPTTSSDGGTASPSAAGSPSAASSSAVDGAQGARDGGGSTIVQAVANADSKDLALYSRIERELKRDPPPEVRALVQKRHAGATRDELVAGARALPDLSLRVLALRWVDDVFPPPGGKSTSPPVPGAKPAASPSGRPHVQPITPTTPK